MGGTLGPYRLDRELGAGGMGRVWAARVEGRAPGLDVGAVVALKVVHPHLVGTPGCAERFLREAAIGKAVVHANVVRTFDCDSVVADGARADFLVMEYVEGQTLRGLLDELERVPEELCRHIGREVAKGLGAIHAAGVVHRDVKPENVLITGDHAVKVMDLGVARLRDEALRLSQTGAFVGSIHYAAPECFADGGRRVDGRTDLHALGLVLYELASGVNPYYAETVPEVLRRVLHEAPRRLGEVNPQLSPFFEEVVHTLLAKSADERFADAAALVAALDGGEESVWWRDRARAIRAATRRPLRRIRIPRETEVHGRDAELAKLRAVFASAKAGDGQVVLLEGEAGIGKSRLVDEFVARLQREGEDVDFLFGSYPPGGAATAGGALSTAFREHVGEADVRAYLPQTPLLAPAFDALLRGDALPPGCEALTSDSVATCFVQALRALAAARPVVLLVDDLHFASEESRATFTSLALAAPGHRILLVGTARPPVEERWLAALTRLPQTTLLAVGRLGPKDLVALLRDSFRSEALAASLSARIATKSDGNPFFAFEIIRGLREGRFITQKDDGTWASARVVDEIQVPSSVLDLVNARVADLSEEERDLLDVACCWGFEFDPGLVGDVLGVERIPLLKRFGQIERRHRLVRAAGRNYAFDHHQVQEALYGSLHEQVREAYHAALAAALERRTRASDADPAALEGALAVDLCEHFLKGAQGERALRYLDAAQAHLSAGYLNAGMVALTERALAVPDLLTGVPRAKALLRLCGTLDRLGRRRPQEACAREAERLAEAAGERALCGEAARALGTALWRTSRWAEAETWYRRALDHARAAGDRNAEAAATGGVGSVLAAQGRYAEAREFRERHLALARETGDLRSEAVATLQLGNVPVAEGRFAEAIGLFERGLSLFREAGDRQGEAAATGNLGGTLGILGRRTEALQHHERKLALCREIGDRGGEANATTNLGALLQEQGRLAEAREHHERGLALVCEIGDRKGQAGALYDLGMLHVRLGDPGGARRLLSDCLALCREIAAPRTGSAALAGLGAVADEEGDPAGALRLAEEALALRRETGDVRGVADSLEQVADLRRRANDADGAGAAAREAMALAREQGRKGSVASCAALLANLPGGDAQSAVEALAAAGPQADRHGLRFRLWQATRDCAHLAEARRLLDFEVDHAPADCRGPMLANVRSHREIASAAAAEGLHAPAPGAAVPSVQGGTAGARGPRRDAEAQCAGDAGAGDSL